MCIDISIFQHVHARHDYVLDWFWSTIVIWQVRRNTRMFQERYRTIVFYTDETEERIVFNPPLMRSAAFRFLIKALPASVLATGKSHV